MAKPLTMLRSFKYECRSVMQADPRLRFLDPVVTGWQQVKILRHHRRFGSRITDCVVTARTELVLDGFPGSANTFATAQFLRAQNRQPRLAHHMHSPWRMIRATDLAIPTVLTLRDPAGATSSVIRRWSYVTPAQCLRSYLRFYGTLQPHLDRMLLSPFETTTQDLGFVIATVNRRFGTDFVEPDPPGPDDTRDEARAARRAGPLRLDDEASDLLAEAEELHSELRSSATAMYRTEEKAGGDPD